MGFGFFGVFGSWFGKLVWNEGFYRWSAVDGRYQGRFFMAKAVGCSRFQILGK